MEKYKISVIVPTYNSGLFLNALFDSIMYQSIGFEHIQVIFVDDNSNDDYTLYLLELFDEKFSNVKSVFLDENNGFPGKGRNIGLSLSKAEYVIFSDHDDTYVPNAFEKLYDAALKENADVVISNYYRVYPGEREKVKTVFCGENIIVDNVYQDTRLFAIDPAIWCKLFRKDFLYENNIRFLEGMLAEDLYFYIVCLFKSNSIVYLDDFYSYNYYIRNIEGDRSTIHIRNKKYMGKMVEGYWMTNQFLEDNGLDEYYADIFNMHFVYWLSGLIISDISDADKLDLIKSVNELFKKNIMVSPGFGERIFLNLNRPITEDNYKEILKRIKSIKRYRRILDIFTGTLRSRR